jgi:hypothetical protein
MGANQVAKAMPGSEKLPNETLCRQVAIREDIFVILRLFM